MRHILCLLYCFACPSQVMILSTTWYWWHPEFDCSQPHILAKVWIFVATTHQPARGQHKHIIIVSTFSLHCDLRQQAHLLALPAMMVCGDRYKPVQKAIISIFHCSTDLATNVFWDSDEIASIINMHACITTPHAIIDETRVKAALNSTRSLLKE